MLIEDREWPRPRLCSYGADVVTVLAVAGTAAAVASAGVGAYAASESAAQQNAAAKFNARVAENNALAERNAALLESDRAREEGQVLRAKQRALIGASGVDESGSPLAVLIETAQQAEREAEIIKYGGEIGARGQENASKLYGFTGKSALRAGRIQTGSTLLTAVPNAITTYRNIKAGGSR